MAMAEETYTPIEPDSTRANIRQHIIDVAAEAFAANGYARTTTRSLAAAAGVSEVTIFRHFGNKENLFMAIMECYGGPAIAAELEAQLTGDYRFDLHTIGKHAMEIILERSKFMRLMFCEAEHFPELAKALAVNPRQFRQMLSRYLGQQEALGRLRPLNTDAAAQAFWGMIFAYGLILETLQEEIPGDLPPEKAVAHFVDIFIEGTIKHE
jgi:AcrR family transcriptional regulator